MIKFHYCKLLFGPNHL